MTATVNNDGQPGATPGATTYARRLGLFSGTMAVIGGIIGAGIFRTPGAVAQRVPSSAAALGAWILGGAIALLGAFCFAELGQRRPKAGGGYVYLREAWGPLPAFLYGWGLLLVIATGAIAAVAVTFASYALALGGLPDRFTVPVAVAAIILLSAVNYVGVKPAAVTQNVFTLLKLVALAALIICGLSAGPYHPPPTAQPSNTEVGSLFAGIGAALTPILFTYGGWQQTNFIAEEIVDPERTLPRAIVLGVTGVVIVYLLANLGYLRVLGHAGLAASTAPAADLMRVRLGPLGGSLIAAGIAVSSFGFLNLVILVTPRVFQAMAADGLFFSRLAELHPVYRTPTAAILLQASWAVVLTLTGTFAQLVDYVAFGDWIFFGLTAAAVFRYRGRDGGGGSGQASGSFRIPGHPWTTGLFVLSAAYVVISSVLASPRNALIGSGLLALGLPVYGYWHGRSHRRMHGLRRRS